MKRPLFGGLPAFVAAMVLALPPASAARLVVRSVDRPVWIELRVDGAKRRCRTPCKLELPAGSYRAQVDGLTRKLTLDEGTNEYTVTPTRRAQRIAGFTTLALAAPGIGVAIAWGRDIDIDARVRLTSLAAGLGLMAMSLPMIMRSSAKLHSGAAPRKPPWSGPGHRRRLEIEVGTVVALASSQLPDSAQGRWRGCFGLAYYGRDWLSVGIRGRVGGDSGLAGGLQLTAGARAYARLPYSYVFAGLGLGYGWEELGRRDEGYHDDHGVLAEGELGLRLAASKWVAPVAVLAYQVAHSGVISLHGWRDRLILTLGVSATL